MGQNNKIYNIYNDNNNNKKNKIRKYYSSKNKIVY